MWGTFSLKATLPGIHNTFIVQTTQIDTHTYSKSVCYLFSGAVRCQRGAATENFSAMLQPKPYTYPRLVQTIYKHKDCVC